MGEATVGESAGQRQWLIWSNQKGAWWGPDGRGYTRWMEEARRIVADATVDGQLTRRIGSHLTNDDLSIADEWVVPAPETTTQDGGAGD